MAAFLKRMVRAARLDASVFEEVEADRAATAQALGVVVLSSVAAGIGLGAGIGRVVVAVLISLAAWYIWAFLTYWIGTRMLPAAQTRASLGELLRTLGFAASPGLLRVLAIAPALREIVFLLTAIWMLLAGVVAVRAALDYRSIWRAALVVLIGWVVQWLFILIVLTLLRQPAV